MYFNIIVVLLLLALATVVISRYLKLPKNVALLFVAQPLVMSATPVIVFIGGILSTSMASDPSLATLPVTLLILGVASASIPAALLAKYKGRKFATLTGFASAFIATLLAMTSALIANFLLFMFASFLLGLSAAFVQQMRFAAIESTSNAEDIPRTIAILMLGGLFAAFLGPEVALAGKDLIASPTGFAGSFLMLSGLIIVAALAMIGFKNPIVHQNAKDSEERPLATIIKQPIFLIAILSAAIGYALMSYLMTATPLSMHQMQHHSLQDTKWVIQSHIAAMYLPSLFTPYLVKRLGIKSLLLAGTVNYCVVALISLSGEQVLHYWWALVLLGIGWNFLFLTGTTLLPLSYQVGERHKVQATNDFILFGFQAAASLMAGWVLLKAGWHILVLSSFPFMLVLLATTVYFYRHQRQEAKVMKNS